MIPIRDSLPSRRFPAVTVTLIVINLIVFLYQGYLSTQSVTPVDFAQAQGAWLDEGLLPPPLYRGVPPPSTSQRRLDRYGLRAVYNVPADAIFVTQYALLPAELLSGKDLPPTIPVPIWATMLTSLFLHGSIMHLVGNMLYLWIFGDNVEDAMGRGPFLLFYLLCGGAAALSQIVIDPSSTIPMVGASGAIAGVLAAYFVLYPQSRVLTLIPIFFFLRLITVPAVFLLGFWFVLQVVNGAGSLGAEGGVAYFAHIGGFLAGAILVIPFHRRGTPLTLYRMIRRRLR